MPRIPGPQVQPWHRRAPLPGAFALVAMLLTLGGTANAASPTLALITDSWSSLLSKYVNPHGGVDYPGFDRDFSALVGFIKAHATLDFKGESDQVKKAAYINLYNATMIHNVLRYAHEQKLDLNSKDFLNLAINDLKVPGGNIWNGDYTVELGGQNVTLDQIEHDLLRGNGGGKLADLKVKQLDPRLHAAVNCAAMSCPRVREVAYRPDSVESMLEANIREFMSDDRQFHKVSSSTMRANSIVFWYYEDFEGFGRGHGHGGAGDYLAEFIAPTAADAQWKKHHLKDNFNDRSKVALKLSSAFDFAYDWRVNDARNKP